MLLVYHFMYLGYIVGLTNPQSCRFLPYVEVVVWSEALPDITTILANAMAVNIPD